MVSDGDRWPQKPFTAGFGVKPPPFGSFVNFQAPGARRAQATMAMRARMTMFRIMLDVNCCIQMKLLNAARIDADESP